MLETNEYQKPLDIREIILVDSDEIIPDNKHSYIIKIKDWDEIFFEAVSETIREAVSETIREAVSETIREAVSETIREAGRLSMVYNQVKWKIISNNNRKEKLLNTINLNNFFTFTGR